MLYVHVYTHRERGEEGGREGESSFSYSHCGTTNPQATTEEEKKKEEKRPKSDANRAV